MWHNSTYRTATFAGSWMMSISFTVVLLLVHVGQPLVENYDPEAFSRCTERGL